LPYGIDFFDDVFQASQAGEGLSADQVSELARRLEKVVSGESFEEALDVKPGWRTNVRRDLRKSAYAHSKSSASKWRNELLRYRDGDYRRDLVASVKPTGHRGRLYKAMIASNGKVPSLRSMQRFLLASRQPADGFGAAAEANRSSETNDRS